MAETPRSTSREKTSIKLDVSHVSEMIVCLCGDMFQASGTASAVAMMRGTWEAKHKDCKPIERSGVKTFWLSFCDSDRPKGSQFLGACVVDVTAAEADDAAIEVLLRFPFAQPDSEWIAAAIKKAHAMQCNPGGEVASVDITDAPADKLARYQRNRLYSRAEVEAIDTEVSR